MSKIARLPATKSTVAPNWALKSLGRNQRARTARAYQSLSGASAGGWRNQNSRLARQVGEAHAGMLLEDGGVSADHVDVAHCGSFWAFPFGWLSRHLSVSKRPTLGEPTWPPRPRQEPLKSTPPSPSSGS